PRRQPADPQLLGPRHRLHRRPERLAASGLDLAHDHERTAADHEIELTVTAAPVAGHHLEALTFVPARRQGLPVRAAGAVGVHLWASVSDVVTGPGAPGNAPRRLTGAGAYSSTRGSSSTFTSLKVRTRTLGTNRLLRYMSHTQASRSSTCTRGRS